MGWMPRKANTSHRSMAPSEFFIGVEPRSACWSRLVAQARTMVLDDPSCQRLVVIGDGSHWIWDNLAVTLRLTGGAVIANWTFPGQRICRQRRPRGLVNRFRRGHAMDHRGVASIKLKHERGAGPGHGHRLHLRNARTDDIPINCVARLYALARSSMRFIDRSPHHFTYPPPTACAAPFA